MTEFWLPINGYEGLYEVSDLGRVRSLPRRVPCRSYSGLRVGSRLSPGRLLRLSFPGVKYQGVTLYKDGAATAHIVHRLVLLTFLGTALPGQEACHWNGDSHDNRLSNLRWDTRRANRADGHRLGEIPVGERRPSSKLKVHQIIAIRARVEAGESRRRVAVDFGINPMTVGKIVRRDSWKHVA